jgi:hypothetical protein
MSLDTDRPECPECSMAMITTAKSWDAADNEHRVFECLRCGDVERRLVWPTANRNFLALRPPLVMSGVRCTSSTNGRRRAVHFLP